MTTPPPALSGLPPPSELPMPPEASAPSCQSRPPSAAPQLQAHAALAASAPPTSAQLLPEGRFEGREAFRQRLRDAIAQAAQARWRTLHLADPSFEDWPLGEREVVQALHDWARSGGRLHLLAHSYNALRLVAPRFVQWRVTWDHQIEARRLTQLPASDCPSLLLAPGWCLHRLDPDRSIGWSSLNAERRTALQGQWDEWLRGSALSFAATTLGL